MTVVKWDGHGLPPAPGAHLALALLPLLSYVLYIPYRWVVRGLGFRLVLPTCGEAAVGLFPDQQLACRPKVVGVAVLHAAWLGACQESHSCAAATPTPQLVSQQA